MPEKQPAATSSGLLGTAKPTTSETVSSSPKMSKGAFLQMDQSGEMQHPLDAIVLWLAEFGRCWPSWAVTIPLVSSFRVGGPWHPLFFWHGRDCGYLLLGSHMLSKGLNRQAFYRLGCPNIALFYGMHHSRDIQLIIDTRGLFRNTAQPLGAGHIGSKPPHRF